MDTTALLSGALAENDRSNGNLRKTRFFVCPACGNLILATDEAEICCCGQRLKPLKAQKPDAEHVLTIEKNDGEWYITAAHPMQREHAIAFVALLNGDTLALRRGCIQSGTRKRACRIWRTARFCGTARATGCFTGTYEQKSDSFLIAKIKEGIAF